MPTPNKKQKIVSRKHQARAERERRQRRYVLIGIAAVVVVVVGLILYGILDQNVFQFTQPVAKVGDTTISVKEFQTQVKFTRYQLIRQYDQYYQFLQQFQGDPFGLTPQLQSIEATLTTPATLGKQVLDQMIADIAIAKEATKRGITVTDAQITEQMQSMFGYYANGTPTPTLTPTLFATPTLSSTQLAIITVTPTPTITPTATITTIPTETSTPTPGGPTSTPTVELTATPSGPTATLAPTETATPYTTEQYQSNVKEFLVSVQDLQFTETELRALAKASLLRELVQADMTKDVPTSEEQVWARQILVADEATAQSVITRLNAGEDFGKLAKELSTDSTKDNGGDMGWFGKGKVTAEIETAAFSQAVGAIGQPVKTSAGYAVVQVIDRQVRPLTTDELTAAKDKVFSDWLTAATADPSVVRYDATWQSKVPEIPTFTPQTLPTAAAQPTLPVVIPTTAPTAAK